MNIEGPREYTGNNGVARQGDVLIFKLPKNIELNRVNEITPRSGKLILLEGEMTGHHHSIDVLERPTSKDVVVPIKTSRTVEDMLSKASNVTPAVTNFYKDDGVTKQLVDAGILTRTDLYIGTLEVSGGGDIGVVLKHQEHAGIRLTEGCYYVGRQIESAGAEERVVAD